MLADVLIYLALYFYSIFQCNFMLVCYYCHVQFGLIRLFSPPVCEGLCECRDGRPGLPVNGPGRESMLILGEICPYLYSPLPRNARARAHTRAHAVEDQEVDAACLALFDSF